MSVNQESRFYYHAEGHAFSGEFRRPVRVPIEAQASTSLPTIGGHAHTRVSDFYLPRLVSFKSGHTHVTGSKQDENTFTTQATSILEDLRILDFLTADRIVARLTSQHHRDHSEGHILALGSAFDNLRIGGYEVRVTFRHDLFLECRTYEDLKKVITKAGKSKKMSSGVGEEATLCSLVEKIETDLPGVDIEGHVLRIPHFGTVALAEVFAEPRTRTLTMLRMKLGSPDEGDGTAVEVKVNGTRWP